MPRKDPGPRKTPGRKPTTERLTDKQLRFCQEYLIDLNKTQAAIRAGYSEKTAGQIGNQLLRSAPVKKYLEERTEKVANRLEISAERVLQELAQIGFSRIGDFVTWDDRTMKLVAQKNIPQEQQGVIAEIYETVNVAGVNRRLKLHDKMKALELLGRYLALFTDRVEVNVNPPKPLEEMTDDELRQYHESLVASEGRGGAA